MAVFGGQSVNLAGADCQATAGGLGKAAHFTAMTDDRPSRMLAIVACIVILSIFFFLQCQDNGCQPRRCINDPSLSSLVPRREEGEKPGLAAPSASATQLKPHVGRGKRKSSIDVLAASPDLGRVSHLPSSSAPSAVARTHRLPRGSCPCLRPTPGLRAATLPACRGAWGRADRRTRQPSQNHDGLLTHSPFNATNRQRTEPCFVHLTPPCKASAPSHN